MWSCPFTRLAVEVIMFKVYIFPFKQLLNLTCILTFDFSLVTDWQVWQIVSTGNNCKARYNKLNQFKIP